MLLVATQVASVIYLLHLLFVTFYLTLNEAIIFVMKTKVVSNQSTNLFIVASLFLNAEHVTELQSNWILLISITELFFLHSRKPLNPSQSLLKLFREKKMFRYKRQAGLVQTIPHIALHYLEFRIT